MWEMHIPAHPVGMSGLRPNRSTIWTENCVKGGEYQTGGNDVEKDRAYSKTRLTKDLFAIVEYYIDAAPLLKHRKPSLLDKLHLVIDRDLIASAG